MSNYHALTSAFLSRQNTGILVAATILLVLIASSRFAEGQLTKEQLLGSSVSKADDPKYADLDGAITSFFDGDFDGAATLLQDVVKKNPELPPPGVLLARLFFASDNTADARAALENTTDKYTEDPEAFLLLGELALRENRLTEASLLFKQGESLSAAYDRSPQRKQQLQIDSASGLASIAEARGKWKEAEQRLRQWAELDPQSLPASSRLARALFFQGQHGQAYAIFQKAWEQNKSAPQPEINMGLLYQELVRQGDASKQGHARRAMERAIERDPNSLNTRLAVAQWALESCLLDMAQSNAQAAVKIEPRSLEAKLLLGLVARHRNQFAEAVTAFEAAHLQSPENFLAVNQLAIVLCEQQDREAQQRALSFARINVQTHPDRTLPLGREAAVTLGWVLFRLGNQNQALAAIRAVADSGPVSHDAAFRMAFVLYQGGQAESARRLLLPLASAKSCFPSQEAAIALLKKLQAENAAPRENPLGKKEE